MGWPLIWRKTAEADVRVWKDRAEAAQNRAKAAEQVARREVANRRRATEMYADLYDEHQTVKATVIGEEKAREMADRIASLRQAVTEARAQLAAEKRRADGLQRRLDDAVGLKEHGIADSRPWQPAHQAPKEDGS